MRLKNELNKQKREYDNEISNLRNDYEEKLDKLRNSAFNNNNTDSISNERFDSLVRLIEELKNKMNNTPTVTVPMQGGNVDNSEVVYIIILFLILYFFFSMLLFFFFFFLLLLLLLFFIYLCIDEKIR